MAKATPHSLTVKERSLVAETQPARLRAFDEDTLIQLHVRVRRARDKYVQLHRREVAQQVEAARARGIVSVPPRRSASKAEIFEQALARVSSSLARAARANAAALRAERLASSRRSKPTATTSTPTSPNAEPPTTTARARTRTPLERKAVAATRAAGARRQAERDAPVSSKPTREEGSR